MSYGSTLSKPKYYLSGKTLQGLVACIIMARFLDPEPDEVLGSRSMHVCHNSRILLANVSPKAIRPR